MNFSRNRSHLIAMAMGVLLLPAALPAKDKKVKPAAKERQDEIEVVGHLPLTEGPVRRFLFTQHYSSFYLYAEHDAGKSVTLIDVTKVARPSVLADVAYFPSGGSGSLSAVAGTAALVTEDPGAAVAVSAPQTIRIMDFADPQHPKLAHEFAGVTAMSRDERRGLIFLANPEGIWILHQVFAEDPEVQKAYADYILYNR